MITSDSRKSDVYREATQQLRNIFSSEVLSRYSRSRWWLTYGYCAMMAAASPINKTTWYQVVLFAVGSLCALIAARIASSKSASSRMLRSVPKE